MSNYVLIPCNFDDFDFDMFKQEFEKFVQLLLKTQNKLGEANSTIELATKSSRKIAKKLGDVSQVVGIDYEQSDDDDENPPMIEE